MKHKKWWQSLSLLAVSLLCLCFLGGCGNSDKFAGHWIGTGIHQGFVDTPDCYYDVTIEKNGNNNYLINVTEAFWFEQVYQGYPPQNPQEVTLTWTEKHDNNLTGTAKENNLDLNLPDPLLHVFFTAIEKDGTLQLTDDNGQKITLHKAKDGETTNFKEQFKKKMQEKYNGYSIIWKE